MYPSAQPPAGPEGAGTDGDVARLPGKILETFSSLFQTPDAQYPQDVAEFIATPAGKRPDYVRCM